MKRCDRPAAFLGAVVLLCALPFFAADAEAQTYDLIIANGRVMDPESGLDAIRNIGITGGKIRAISEAPLQGRDTIEATGRTVAPGFIDLNTYEHGDPFFRLRVADGVTSVLNMESGATDVPAYYAALEGRALIHHGAAASVSTARMLAAGDSTILIVDGVPGVSGGRGSAEFAARARRLPGNGHPCPRQVEGLGSRLQAEVAQCAG